MATTTTTTRPTAPTILRVSFDRDVCRIDGSSLGTANGSVSLTVGTNAVSLSISSWSDTQISGKLPDGTMVGGKSVSVVVTTSAGTKSTSFTTTVPLVLYVSPSTGLRSSDLTLSTNFALSTAADAVKVAFGTGKTVVTATASANNQVVVKIPDTAIAAANGSMAIELTRTDVTVSPTASFMITNGGAAVTASNPSSARVGASVTVSGVGFGASQGTVTIGGRSAAITSWTDTAIMAAVPPLADDSGIIVTRNSIASNAFAFQVIPNVASCSPQPLTVGGQMTIVGTGFGTAVGTVKPGTTSAVAVQSWTDTQIVVNVPAGVALGTSWSVSRAGSAIAASFAVKLPATVLSVTPSGSFAVGAQIAISGYGFGTKQGGVLFGGTSYGSVQSWSDTLIYVKATAAGNTNDCKPIAVASVSPTSGPAETLVTFSGYNLDAASLAITFGGAKAKIISQTATQVIAQAPVGVEVTKTTTDTTTGVTTTTTSIPSPFRAGPLPVNVLVKDSVTIQSSFTYT